MTTNIIRIYSSIPTILMATILTLFLIYILSDIAKDKDRAVVLKSVIFSVIIGFVAYQFFLTIVEYCIPLDMFQPKIIRLDDSGVAKRAVYAVTCVYSVFCAGCFFSEI